MPYLLTVSRMDLSARRRRWSDPTYDPGVRTIGSPALPLAYPGALVLVDDDGLIRKGIPLLSPKGMLFHGDRLLVACYDEIRSFSLDLTESSSLVNESWCNDLHSLRASADGILVAATGVDAVAEFSATGATTWLWWAAENGFPTDLRGEPWSLGTDQDHRTRSYPVELQSIHVNAVAPLDDETYVATLLHRDSLITIDRRTGEHRVLLDGVPKPHAARVRPDGLVTYADTTTGEGVLAEVYDGRLKVLQRVGAETRWLHDAHFDGTRWMLADGENARVVHVDAEGEVIRVDQFHPDWCLYEVLPWIGPVPWTDANR